MNKRPVAASAPGKLVLMGEYAVLDGVAALSLAVNRRARAGLRPGKQKGLVVSSSLTPDVTHHFIHGTTAGRNILTALEPASDGASELANWLGHFLSFYRLPEGGWQLSLDTSDFYGETNGRRTKYGLGSSAALCLALSSVLDQVNSSNRDSADRRGQNAVHIHRDIQGGRGSGVDIATSTQGGLVVFKGSDRRMDIIIRSDPAAPSGKSKNVWRPPEPLSVTEPSKDMINKSLGLWRAIWTGSGTSTSDFVQRFDEWREQKTIHWDRLRDKAEVIVTDGEQALKQRNGDTWRACITAYHQWMTRLGQAVGLPIVSPAHDELAKIAKSGGCSYKPSGAGGGDIGLVFAPDAKALEQFTEAAAGAGYTPLALTADPVGLTVESTAS